MYKHEVLKETCTLYIFQFHIRFLNDRNYMIDTPIIAGINAVVKLV